jgi:hypothetical protein
MNKCTFGFHEWNKWEIKEEGEILRASAYSIEKRNVGNYLVQKRSCLRCGKTQMNTMKTYVA